ncbi:multicopper oxidase family protein [Seohaeicola nanhaiensis]|uniref:Multicopper oxidase family protein n=1 Tax=Seohaeicola nanhaiensis TaxID=1387282 RepID=A0ABV9KFW7_9RHOB
MTLTRRQSLGLLGAAALTPGFAALASTETRISLRIQSASAELLKGVMTQGMVSTRPDGPPPVIRMKQGRPFTAKVENATPDFTTMHWHGLRLPNKMDGVPYLTQFPIGQGETFDYEFTPQDAGTYWYHPHCMTMEQMALGLTGIIVVEEAEAPGFDADIALNLRDFRLGSDGQFIDLWTARGAARAGTFGTVMTANWAVEPVEEAPAGGLVRLRIAATDTARIYKLFLPGATGQIIALDGHPLIAPLPLPQSEDTALLLAPGQRADLAIAMPVTEGETIDLMTHAPGAPRRLARLRATGGTLKRELSELKPLTANAIPEPDLAKARIEELVFGWSPEGDLPNDGLCGTLGYTFWSINRTPWPGDAAGSGPLVTLKHGESVILRLRNESPNDHPIHLHGLAFRVIASNRREVSPHWTDTALLLEKEVLDIAFVADNPGDWAFHCHVIEHQKTGLAGYIRIA